jgi:hypothetical protein
MANTTAGCPAGWTADSEFGEPIANCAIPELAVQVLQGIAVGSAALLFLLQCFLYVKRRAAIHAKRWVTQTLLAGTVFANIVMALRPLLSLTLGVQAHTTLWFAIVVHASAASAAGVAILAVYVEARIRVKASLTKAMWLARNAKPILATLGGLQAVAFIAGAIAPHYAPEFKAYTGFWAPVVLVDFVAIPYFLGLGLSIYCRVRNMVDERRKHLARPLLLTVIACAGIGTFTGVVGIVAAAGAASVAAWALVELCWISNVAFGGFIFVLMSRAPARHSTPPTAATEPTTASTESTVVATTREPDP